MGSSLVKKLLLRPGNRAVILNAPEGYLALLEPLPESVQIVNEIEAGLDFVQLFVRGRAEVEALAHSALGAVRPGGLFWLCYPKGTSGVATDINRDSLVAMFQPWGWRGVAVVSIDDTWSAIRFRQ